MPITAHTHRPCRIAQGLVSMLPPLFSKMMMMMMEKWLKYMGLGMGVWFVQQSKLAQEYGLLLLMFVWGKLRGIGSIATLCIAAQLLCPPPIPQHGAILA